MPGPFAYRSGHGRSAPVVDIVIAWRSVRRVIEALVDSGASSTVIPASLVDELGLRKLREQTVYGFDHQPRKVGVYAADVEFAGLTLSSFPVFAVPGKAYALVGRDILNRRITILDGPRLELSLT